MKVGLLGILGSMGRKVKRRGRGRREAGAGCRPGWGGWGSEYTGEVKAGGDHNMQWGGEIGHNCQIMGYICLYFLLARRTVGDIMSQIE